MGSLKNILEKSHCKLYCILPVCKELQVCNHQKSIQGHLLIFKHSNFIQPDCLSLIYELRINLASHPASQITKSTFKKITSCWLRGGTNLPFSSYSAIWRISLVPHQTAGRYFSSTLHTYKCKVLLQRQAGVNPFHFLFCITALRCR